MEKLFKKEKFLLERVKCGFSKNQRNGSEDVRTNHVLMAQSKNEAKYVSYTHFPFGLGCSGAFNAR